MTNDEFDLMLSDALMDANMLRYSEVIKKADEGPEFDYSEKYKKWISRLLNNPEKYSKKYTRNAFKRVLINAACIILVFTMLSVGTLAVSPQARAIVKRYILEWSESDVMYRFSGERGNEKECAAIDEKIADKLWLPNGYEKGKMLDTSDGYCFIYDNKNDKDKRIVFICVEMFNGGGLSLNTEGSEAEKIIINDNTEADLYMSDKDSVGSNIVWTDNIKGCIYSIDAFVTRAELIKMAKSVIE